MPVFNIGEYTAATELLLREAGKYFALLLFAVLAIRLWRRWIGNARDVAGFGCAAAVTAGAVAIGYFSLRQSLGSLYSYYGMRAFHEGHLPQALVLFETADRNWRTPDTIGQEGVCRLMMGEADPGRALIARARAARKGESQFEDFYEGVYLFARGDIDQAVPRLEVASVNDDYRWNVVKIFAVIDLETNRVADAARLMQPFMQAEVTDPDQAYILASLKLAAGKKAEARALLDRFPEAELSPLWQERYKKLRARLGD